MKFGTVTKEVLLFLAGCVWLAAGINVALIGVKAYAGHDLPMVALLAVGSAAIFAIFWRRVFSRMLGKHVERILGYGDDRQPFWRFFDTQAFIIMAVMMSVGISLRAFSLVPMWFIAFFYTGLGIALASAGAGFMLAFDRAMRAR